MAHEHNDKKIGWTILLNITITIAEYIGGTMSGSLALLSDAGHNFSDVLSLILGYFGEKISAKKATKEHSFGFKRFEVLTALINALVLVGVAFYILFEAVNRINDGQQISLGLMLGVGAIGLLGNLISIIILSKDKDSSVNMKAAFLHLFYDTLSSVFVMVGAVIIYFTGYVVVDLIASIIIAVMILYSSLEIIKKTILIFMQGVPQGIDFDNVYNAIKNIKDVKTVHGLHIWSVDSNEVFLSCHVCIEKVKNSYDIVKRINQVLLKDFNIGHTTIQLENNDICKSDSLCCK